MEYQKEKIKVPKFEEKAGFYTTRKRSRIMSRIRAKDTKPELRFRKALWGRGIRYRVNSNRLPGKPDVSITKYKLAIFIDGEFWHGYDWDVKRETINSNRGFWIPKIERNIQKDQEVNRQLREMGFTVFRFWAGEVKGDLDTCVNDVVGYIRSYPYLAR